jgi:hypothetical protein
MISKTKAQILFAKAISKITGEPLYLKSLPESDIMTTLKDFNVTQDNGDITMIGLAALDKNNIIKSSDGTITFKNKPSHIEIYTYNDNNALRQCFPNKEIVEIAVNKLDKSMILDFTDYDSVVNTYTEAIANNETISNDNDLLNYAIHKRLPHKRIVILERDLGDKAFEGSRVTKYKVTCAICYDADLILAMKIYQNNISKQIR